MTAPPSPEAPAASSASDDRAAALADIRRAASLEDLALDVSVAHTNQRLRARFCVTLRRARRWSWAFGVDIKETKQFASELAQLAKAHTRGKCDCAVAHPSETASCPMCVAFRRELKSWPAFPAFSTLGKRHLDAKCALLAAFFTRVFRVLSRNAQWLQSCALLRDVLRRTEALCKIQYDDERAARHVIASLARVSNQHDNSGDSDCSICLGDLFAPAEAATADSSDGDELSKTAQLAPQPAQGVELPCGHRFHDTCVCLWFHTRLNCPVCRQEPPAAVADVPSKAAP